MKSHIVSCIVTDRKELRKTGSPIEWTKEIVRKIKLNHLAT